MSAGQRAFDRSMAKQAKWRSNAERSRKMVTLTLSPEALARLDELAETRGTSRSGAVEQLVRNARLASGK